LEQKLPIDGKDVWPMLTENTPSPHDAILSVRSPTQAALRIGDWKLISRNDLQANGGEAAKNKTRGKKRQQEAAPIELYNLTSDIGETTNLADKEPDRVATMSARLGELLKDAVPSGAPVGNEAE
jgi:hypothetical protein